MNLRLIVTILVIAAAPVCAQAQKPPRFMETSILVTDLAQQFSLSLGGPRRR